MKKIFVSLLTLCVLSVPLVAHAETINFALAVQFSNSTQPNGPGPWLTGTLTNTGPITPGFDTRLTLTASGISNHEFISGVYLSIDPLLNPTQVTTNLVQNTPDGAYQGISRGVDAFQADGDGKYDLFFGFNTNAASRFSAGESVIIDLDLITGSLKPSDFAFLSTPGGGNGPFYAAAHLQGIGPQGNDSTWIGLSVKPTPFIIDPPPVPTPEPATMVLLGTGLVAAFRARRKKSA